jgi:50S ribosomal protein L16 3-hydroxylase
MNVDAPCALLGGLSPAAFMKRHWQKRPLLVRQAVPGVRPPVTRDELFALAQRDDVESRLVAQRDGRWSVRHGPFARRALPPFSRGGWTLLVQGLDLHVQAAHELLARFRFVPAARLDDLMISYASDGGGVGPHVDSYDVFLLQGAGRRRWRIGRTRDLGLRDDVPLKILRRFEPEHDWVLEPGDMLYLPPQWAHDGIAVGADCMTCSVGFRVPWSADVAGDLLARLADTEAMPANRIYRDPAQRATARPGAVPPALQDFAEMAVQRCLAQPGALQRALGESLSEPKANVVFEAGSALPRGRGVRLDRRTRMVYDARHVYINGEAFVASGTDARVMRQLADALAIDAAAVARLSAGARETLDEWARAGWVRAEPKSAPMSRKRSRP